MWIVDAMYPLTLTLIGARLMDGDGEMVHLAGSLSFGFGEEAKQLGKVTVPVRDADGAEDDQSDGHGEQSGQAPDRRP